MLDSDGQYVDVDGARLACGVSGSGDRVVVLVHGAGAHRWWWHRVEDALRRDFRVLAVDLSGHGDSDWRENYGPRHFGRDVAGVIAQLVDGPVTLVGHSMGGLASIVAAADPRSKVDSLVLLDSILRPPSRRRIGTWPVGSRGHHSTSEAARARFRLVPAQPSLPAEIVDPVAERAVVRADAGWTWKFDPRARVAFDDEYVDRQLAGVTCAITYAYGSDSKLRTRDARDELLKKQPDTRIERVEGGHHHLPLDSPRQCVDIIRAAAMVSHADDSAI